jgi:hypothetical protein
MDPVEFDKRGLDRSAALADLNASLSRGGLQAFLDETDRCQLRRATHVVQSKPRNSAMPPSALLNLGPPDAERGSLGSPPGRVTRPGVVPIASIREDSAASVSREPVMLQAPERRLGARSRNDEEMPVAVRNEKGGLSYSVGRHVRVLRQRAKDNPVMSQVVGASLVVAFLIAIAPRTSGPTQALTPAEAERINRERQEQEARAQSEAEARRRADQGARERASENEDLDPTLGDCPLWCELAGAHPPKGTKEWCQEQTADGSFRPHGPWSQWSEGSQILAKGHYRHGKQVGRWSFFDLDGKRSVVDYHDGSDQSHLITGTGTAPVK